MFLDIHRQDILIIHQEIEIAGDLLQKVQGKLVVAGSHRGVGGKDAFRPHRFNLDAGRRYPWPDRSRFFMQKLQGEKGGVPLVHVKPLQVPIPQGPEDAYPADAQDDFLAQAVPSSPP